MSSLLLRNLPNNISFAAVIQHVRKKYVKQLFSSSPSTIFLLPVLLVPVIKTIYRRIQRDYELFLSLGPGGTPSTPLGYLKVCVLRALIANREVYAPPKCDPITDKPGPYFQSILDIPSRQGPRPAIAGIAPQRQISQRSNGIQIAALQSCMRALVGANDDTLDTGRSCFEKQSLAIFLKGRDNKRSCGVSRKVPPETNPNFSDLHEALLPDDYNRDPINATCGLPPEVAHMHGSEGSLHLTLHPEDAAIVIERGWGERHPLAGAGGLVRDICNGKGWRALYGSGPSEGWLPKGFLMVYAPKNEEELKIVGRIVRAGAWWVGGVKLRESEAF